MPFEPTILTDSEDLDSAEQPDADPDSIEPIEDPADAEQPDAPDAEQPEPIEPDAPDTEQDPRLRKARQDAASYRTQLRQAEADRDAARALLTAARTQIAEEEHALTEWGRAVPWKALAATADVDAMFTDDGRFDRDRHDAIARDVADKLGLTPKAFKDRNWGPAQRETPPGPAFESAFTPRSRR